MTAKKDPTDNPSLTLLMKLGSIAVHADELLSDDGHELDRVALNTVLYDPEVTSWLEQMKKLAYIPRKRK
jgi:hypothetical protein